MWLGMLRQNDESSIILDEMHFSQYKIENETTNFQW
jgi:hypothetical protein